MKRRILSTIMALTLCVNLCPAWAMAEESTSGTYMHYPEHTQDYSHMEERHSMEAEYSSPAKKCQ